MCRTAAIFIQHEIYWILVWIFLLTLLHSARLGVRCQLPVQTGCETRFSYPGPWNQLCLLACFAAELLILEARGVDWILTVILHISTFPVAYGTGSGVCVSQLNGWRHACLHLSVWHYHLSGSGSCRVWNLSQEGRTRIREVPGLGASPSHDTRQRQIRDTCHLTCHLSPDMANCSRPPKMRNYNNLFLISI